MREGEEVAVVGKGSHLRALVIVTDTDDRNQTALDQGNQLLHITTHANDNPLPFCLIGSRI